MNDEIIKEKEESKPSISFIEQFIAEDLKEGKNNREDCYTIPSRA